MAIRHQRGRAGEAAVAAYLKRRGWQILHQNFRGRRGEIDIVARDGSALVFVEVKSRRSYPASSLHAIGPQKRRRIIAVAQEYIVRRRLHGVAMRFDAAAVRLDDQGRPGAVFYVVDAFSGTSNRGY